MTMIFCPSPLKKIKLLQVTSLITSHNINRYDKISINHVYSIIFECQQYQILQFSIPTKWYILTLDIIPNCMKGKIKIKQQQKRFVCGWEIQFRKFSFDKYTLPLNFCQMPPIILLRRLPVVIVQDILYSYYYFNYYYQYDYYYTSCSCAFKRVVE